MDWVNNGKQGLSWIDVAEEEAVDSVVAAGKAAKTPAPKKDQVKGSKTNKPDSSKDTKSASSIKFSERVETSLRNKVEDHNEKAKKGRKVSLPMLKAVYRRGAGAYSTSHRPGMTRDQWAMGRVNAFLKLVRSGKPDNSAYTTDNDLLPASHPKSTKKSNSITASGLVPEEQALADALLDVVKTYGKFDEDGTGVWAGYTPARDNEDADIGVICRNCVFYTEDAQGNDVCQIIALPIEDLGKCRLAVIPDGLVNPAAETNLEEAALIAATYVAHREVEAFEAPESNSFSSSDSAILALTEASGLGYEAEFAIKASWLRAVEAGESPYERARQLSLMTYEGQDADLLPVRAEESVSL